MTDKQFGRLVGQTVGELDEIINRLKWDRKMLIEIAENKSDSATDKLFKLHIRAMLLTLRAKQVSQDLNKRWNAIAKLIGWDIPDDWKDLDM